MSEIVDRVAKIIDPIAFGDYPDTDIDHRHGWTWANTRLAMRERARGVIAAMRNPTDEMVSGLCRLAYYKPGSHSALQIWQATIDAALS